MFKVALASLALLLTLTGCAFGVKAAGATTGRITGHVTVRACGGANNENQTGCRPQPSPGVTIEFKETASGRLFHATTDANGAYAINLSPGAYEATPQPGVTFGPVRDFGPAKPVTVVAGKTATADFSYAIQLM